MAERPEDASTGAAIVIPLRSFADGKVRLASILADDERAALARTMADAVVAAAGALPVAVVSSDPAVVSWATAHGCQVLHDPGSLNGAAAAGREWARRRGDARVAIVHGDLPLARSLERVVADGAEPVAVIVPDHRNDGTPVLSLPTVTPYVFAYGPGSAAAHAREAEQRGLAVRILPDRELGFDIDVEADLHTLAELRDRAAP
jgi:2-phospho-L-lactate guanylyltransferase